MAQYWKVTVDTNTGNINFREVHSINENPYLDIPYHSQWEVDALRFKSDCGPACIEMVGEYYTDRDVTTDDIMAHITGGVNRTTSSQELINAAKHFYDVDLTRTITTWEQLKSQILLARPAIALVHYGSFIMRLDRNYTSGHWVVITGFDEINNKDDIVERVIIHDPNWWGTNISQGAYIPVVKNHFMDMWESCNLDGNPNNLALLSYKG